MRIIIFGASGMVGQGLLREALQSNDVRQIVLVGRSYSGLQADKLQEIVVTDLAATDYLRQAGQFDVAYFCLGSSAAGLSEADYAKVNYQLPLTIASALAASNPQMQFVYVSGEGTDSSEQGRVMWARVKGKTENALKALPFKAVYLFRPGFIRPLDGIRSKTGWYNLMYRTFNLLYWCSWPILPLFMRMLTANVVNTRILGRAMLAVVKLPPSAAIIDNRNIYQLGSKGKRASRLSVTAKLKEALVRLFAAAALAGWVYMLLQILFYIAN